MVVFSEIESALNIRNNIDSYSTESGVYMHFVDEKGLKLLKGVCPVNFEKHGKIKLGLVYIGKAQNMKQRLRWHLGIINIKHVNICNGTLSTLRHSYMANHSDIECLSQQDKLNEFLDNYVYIKYCLSDQYKSIEEEMIRKYSPPLNIQGNTNPFIATNKERRKAIRDAYREKFVC